MAGVEGFEPSTGRFGGGCASSRASLPLVLGSRFELETMWLSTTRVYLVAPSEHKLVPAEGVEPPVLAHKECLGYSQVRSPLRNAGNIKELGGR